jgi:hypothetical protein
MARVSRSVIDMANALGKHMTLLGRYIEAVKQGDDAYLGEIAGKLRLLVVSKGNQKPLLLRLADLAGYDFTVTLTGPPGWTFMDGDKTGDTIKLEKWLSNFAVGVQTANGPVQLTNAQFVTVWAEQYGAAHEDWSITESFAASLGNAEQMKAIATVAAASAPPDIAGFFEVFAGNPPATILKLMEVAMTVYRVGAEFLNALTPERLEAAENELRRRQGRPSLEEEARGAG